MLSQRFELRSLNQFSRTLIVLTSHHQDDYYTLSD